MQQSRDTTKLYRLPPDVIYFLFYCKSNLFFIFLNKNIISFTILSFTDVFKRHFENIFLPHEKGDSR